jgi:uncharacterized repeat protein (TIGR03803 family)
MREAVSTAKALVAEPYSKFKIDARGTGAILHVFLSAEPYGIIPFGGLIRDQGGNLYGTANAGGAFPESGTIFRVDSAGVMTVLYNLMGGTDGSAPFAPLILDAAGNLYGTTELGGDPSCKLLGTALGCGTVFKSDTAGRETVLYTFRGVGTGDSQMPVWSWTPWAIYSAPPL